MNNSPSTPLVSCVMPTTSRRRRFVPQAIRYFQNQTYENKELLIVDDGPESLADIVPNDPQVRYLRLTGERTLGRKRNLCVEAARGDLIMHWDDDDWTSPRRISYQTEELLSAGAEICGVRQMIFYELATGRTWLYEYPAHQRPWLAGGSLLYTREFWSRAPFPDFQVASDTRFVMSQRLKRFAALPDYSFYVAMIHPDNTSPKNCRGSYWSSWQGNLANIMGADYAFYQNLLESEPPQTTLRRSGSTVTVAAAVLQPVKNRRDSITRQSAVKLPLNQPGLSQSNHERGCPMRIGYVLKDFSPLSEAFIRREIIALCGEGHRVFVYTNRRHYDRHVPEPSHPNLIVREVRFVSNPGALSQAALADGIEHLHGSLMSVAHRATFAAARTLQTAFTLRAYSGHDIFTKRDPDLYRAASSDPLCVSLVVEDGFMRDWMIEQLGVAAEKISIVPNSFDMDLYRLPETRAARASDDRVVVLAIARFVEKKGLRYLVAAFNQLCAAGRDAELWLVGYGPEEQSLRKAARGNDRIKFLGAKSEAETRDLYAAADIFCLPCIQTTLGDADGVPTTVLEAMAFGLPVVSTNLLSMSCYVRDGHDGLLVTPGAVAPLAEALERLCADAKLREDLGRAARAQVSENCDIKRSVKQLEEIFIAGRWASWSEKLTTLGQQRLSYTTEREDYYTECRVRAVNYFQPAGKLLEVGCGSGKLRDHLPPEVEYYGCDAQTNLEMCGEFPFVSARAERLPFKDNAFDAVVFYAVLIHVFGVDQALAEAARVLKPGGQLYLQECYDDPNPVHLNHFSRSSLRERVSQRFNIIRSDPANKYLMMMVAEKPFAAQTDSRSAFVAKRQPKQSANLSDPRRLRPRVSISAAESAPHHNEQGPLHGAQQPARHTETQAPLASICITAYNRAELLRTCIDSALRQTHSNVEVIVVDDGSTDGTRQVLESYGATIRAAYNEQKRGIAFSKNRALMMTSSQARYVGILDSDDYFDPRFVERCVDHLEKNAGVGLVYADDILIDRNGRELQRRRAVEPWSVEGWLRTCNLRGDTWMGRRELIMKTTLHDESLSHDVDYDLFYQLLEITTFAHLQEFLVFYRQHGGQSGCNDQALAKCHAANLVKYGYSADYAYLRARRHPEWLPAIEEGIALGSKLRERRASARG